jgi:hypothetical protein
MDTTSIAAMEKRISAVYELLRTERGYRDRVDRMQTQISDMINENSEGRNMLEKALDMLDQSHEEQCSRINSRIEKNFHSMRSSHTSSEWTNSGREEIVSQQLRGSFSAFSNVNPPDELPQEIRTLD